MPDWIYLDHHATTPCRAEVVEAMSPWWGECFGNPHSPHQAGREAADGVAAATAEIANVLHADADEVAFTSGATESNNLAIMGVCRHPRQTRRKIITVQSEHPAVLDPFHRLAAAGFEVHRLAVAPQTAETPGEIDLQRLTEQLDEQTALVSVMWANNEIGVVQPMQEIAARCHAVGALLHTDATQAVGRLPVDVRETEVDLLSASAHKFYGPKGTGLLFVRRRGQRVRLLPLIEGGGQQAGLRSGTLNPPGIVGMAAALRLAAHEQGAVQPRIAALRDRLWAGLQQQIEGVALNGPALSAARLPGNLNVRFPGVEGEALMSAIPRLCCSSGSACSSVDPAPSHVLAAIGLSEAESRSSLRFGIGRDNCEAEIDQAVAWLGDAYRQLRQLA